MPLLAGHEVSGPGNWSRTCSSLQRLVLVTVGMSLCRLINCGVLHTGDCAVRRPACPRLPLGRSLCRLSLSRRFSRSAAKPDGGSDGLPQSVQWLQAGRGASSTAPVKPDGHAGCGCGRVYRVVEGRVGVYW